LLLLGCSSSPGKRSGTSLPETGRRGKFEQTGVASWYGKPFHGRKTSSGETYNMMALTAAHPTLPFGTVVRVTNLKNKKSVKVKINDRGPFKKGRIIDLSYSAARTIGLTGPGTGKVKVEVVKWGRETGSD